MQISLTSRADLTLPAPVIALAFQPWLCQGSIKCDWNAAMTHAKFELPTVRDHGSKFSSGLLNDQANAPLK